MGIRIKKILGYGLTDIVKNDERFARQPNDAWEWIDEHDQEFVPAYLTWVREQRDETDRHPLEAIMLGSAQTDRKRYRGNPTEMFTYNDEFGDPAVMCVTPACCPDWTRHDDMLDYCEHTIDHQDDGAVPIVRPYPGSLYPWNDYVDVRTGRTVRDAFDIRRTGKYLRPRAHEEVCPEILTRNGFTSFDDAEANLAPMIPSSVRFLCEWAGLFKEPKSVYLLRPLIYSYWS